MDQTAATEVVMRARRLRETGATGEALALLTQTLDTVVADGDHVLAAMLTHDLGHTEPEPRAQLRWHLACLDHIEAVGDDRVRGFHASAHANLARTHLHLGDLPTARHHLELGEAAATALPDDPYGAQVRAGLAALRRAITTD